MKAIERNISMHGNGTLYFVARRGGKLTRQSFHTKLLSEARRQLPAMWAGMLSPVPDSVIVAGVGDPAEVANVVSVCLGHPNPEPTAVKSWEDILSDFEAGHVWASDGTDGMRKMGRKACLRYCKSSYVFSPVVIWNGKRSEATGRYSMDSSCNHVLFYLQRLTPWGIQKGYFGSSSMVELGRLKRIYINPRKIIVPTVSMVGDLLAMVASEDKDSGDFLRFVANTGFRLSGANCLKWTSIDLRQKVIFVTQKGRKIREIPVTRGAVEVLKSRRSLPVPFGFEKKELKKIERRLKRFAKGLLDEHGNPCSLTYYHAFRHYFASQALMSGLSVLEVSELLGHNDGGSLVLKVYGHLCNRHLRTAVAGLVLAA